MANKIAIKPRPYKHRPATPWIVEIPRSIIPSRPRRFFATFQEAENFCNDFRTKLLERGATQALNGDEGLSLAEMKGMYLVSREGKVGHTHLKRVESALGLMASAWAGKGVKAIRVSDVERFLAREDWGPRTRWNALGYVHAFFEWARRRGYVDFNPASAVVAETEKPSGKKEIYSPFEMRILLGLTRRERNVIERRFLCYSAFQGLRSIEIMRSSGDDTDWKDGEIHVTTEAAKRTKRGARPRYVKIRPLFKAFCPPCEGKLIRLSTTGLQYRMERLRIRMHRVLMRIGRADLAARWEKEWPHNAGRHSFASYLLAEKEDAGYVAHQLGHTSPAMVHESYARAVKRRDLEEWKRIVETCAKYAVVNSVPVDQQSRESDLRAEAA